ncbi:aldose epimerase family protein [Pedobacter deserti]|uniref:aldose epimerase family protein n=1 Tax=Pedobacter deserti TaxID=2817382 RepID=UPI00210A0985|nr:aldose epimerase family protein [Pedobacter sp. SYSU D00382]
MKMLKNLIVFVLLLLHQVCATAQEQYLTKHLFGKIDGQEIYEYVLTNAQGMQVKLISYGATITDIRVPDRNGVLGSVVLGFDSLHAYTSPRNPLMGAIVGRVANRIAKGRFTIGAQEYILSSNIHGGKLGFDKRIWNVEEIRKGDGPGIRMSYLSRDGEEGYPGNLEVSVSYTLTNKNELRIDYTATTDRPTHVNLTNHTYFNLSGGGSATVLDTELRIWSDKYLEADRNNIPSGKILPVNGTALDFSRAQAIGERIKDEHPALKIGNGYDLTYVLKNQSGKLRLAAQAYDPHSGRVLKAYSTEPGLVFYTGNHLNRGLMGRQQKPMTRYGGFCLEFQHYPDAPNQPKFPSTLLKPGEVYRSQTVFEFVNP